MTSQQSTVHVVPHSHWDREWYFTLEDSNILLIENLDYLINVLEKDDQFKTYVFDGQTSVIEEYLHKCPGQRERVVKLITQKRLHIGPWYTQTDSLLVNTESLIRNLLYGSTYARQLGHSMRVGYLPDIFGQNAYLPSIFSEFGLDYALLQRGVYTDALQGAMNFHWQSPDGKTIPANNMYYGYGPGKFLSKDEAFVQDRLNPILDRLEALNAGTDHVLLPSGGDQVLIRDHFPETVQALNDRDEPRTFQLSDYETFLDKAWENHDAFSNVISGELLASQKSRIHHTIGSQRYDIKQLNDQAERKLLYGLEPLSVIARTFGLSVPQAWLDHMWKELFDVHAHDSIAGCNSDDTNRDITERLKKVIRTADGLINLRKKQMTRAISHESGHDNILVLFNTKTTAHVHHTKAIIFTEKREFSLTTCSSQPAAYTLINQSYISGGKKIVVTAEGEKQVEEPGYYRSEIFVHDASVPAMGYDTLLVNEQDEASQPTEENTLQASNDEKIENHTLAVHFNNGSLTFENKQLKTAINHFLTFEDVADAGDSYDFSPLSGDKPVSLEDCRLIKVEKGSHLETMVVSHTAEVPAALHNREESVPSDTRIMAIETTFTLLGDEELLRVNHRISNTVRDHRVRVLLQTPVANPSRSFADQGFSLVERETENPHMASWKEKGFVEAPVPIYPLEHMAGINDHNFLFAAFTKGIKEYQVLPETGQLALTLFRSVGLLGRDDLAWRPGRASGINNKVVKTPDAQMQQAMTFDYALVFGTGKNRESTLFTAKTIFDDSVLAYQKQTLNTFEERLERFEIPYPADRMPLSHSLFTVKGEGIYTKACKPGMLDDSVIIRLFNPCGQEQHAEIHSGAFTSFSLCRLNEETVKMTSSAVTVPAKGYVTVKAAKSQ